MLDGGRREATVAGIHQRLTRSGPGRAIGSEPLEGRPISFWELTRKGVVMTAVTVLVAAPYLWLTVRPGCAASSAWLCRRPTTTHSWSPRKRTLSGTHHQPFEGRQRDDLVGIGESPAEEMSDEVKVKVKVEAGGDIQGDDRAVECVESRILDGRLTVEAQCLPPVSGPAGDLETTVLVVHANAPTSRSGRGVTRYPIPVRGSR
ncbi:hypothetical protein OHA18_42155 [Kribbella sp. NBC_00709]|uniref:hypothetical protein n=1 Tax=Kribbella sp. NBC_00709 TaxID=2975972 RepID=UPI002E2D28A0|nr:hypothetical protein [Kribbella sp. NBC_00709]